MEIFKPNKTYFKDEFLPKLEIGKYWEIQAQKRIIKYFNEQYIIKNTCNDNNYDFELTNNIKYEVKTDIRATLTNNIFIEFLQFGKHSGIEITKSNYYIIITPYKKPIYILIDVLELKFLISTKQYKLIIQPTQKNNYTSGYIFDINIIIKNSILI